MPDVRAPTSPGPTPGVLVAAPASVLATVSRRLTVLRRSKPVHPRGVVLEGELVRHGSAVPWGVPFLDGAGGERALVRLSRSVGFPPGWPDVLGLAVRLLGTAGPHDLLLDSAGMRPLLRHLPVPRRDPFGASYGSVFPYDAAGTAVLLSAVPYDDPVDGIRAAFRLLVATSTGPWWHFATLRLEPPDQRPPDAVHFDPVVNQVPGLRLLGPLASLRAPSYAAARAARAAHTRREPDGSARRRR